MIPYERINQGASLRLMDYLIEELRRAQAARKDLEAKWVKWDKLYRNESMKLDKNFPFAGSADLPIPVIATDVETMWSQLMGTMFGPPNVWSVGATLPEFSDYAKRVEEFLTWAQNNELAIYNTAADWALELVKKGTAVLKTRYAREYKRVYEFRENEQGVSEAHPTIMVRNAPAVEHVSLANFYIPPGYASIQAAPWVAELQVLNLQEVIKRAQHGHYIGVDRIQGWLTSRGSHLDIQRQEREKYRVSYGDRIELYDFCVDWDIEGNGEFQSLICTVHPDSRTYLRIDYNPTLAQEKFYEACRYVRVEGSFYGIGLCEMLESTQIEVTTMHCQRIDNGTLANTNAFTVLRSAAKNFRDRQPVYPGMRILVDSHEDIRPFTLGQKYDSTVGNEQLSVGYAQRRTGVSDYATGTPGPETTYATATSTLEMVRSGRKRADQVMREVRECWSTVGMRVLELYQQYNQYGKPFMALGQEDGKLVQEVLMFPLDIMRRGCRVDLTATSAAANKEMEVRTNTLLSQMLDQYHQQVLQFMAIALSPQTPTPLRAVALQAVEGKSILLRRVFDAYGVQDFKKLVPSLEEAFNVGIQQHLNPGQAAGLGGSSLTSPNGQQPGMAAVPTGGGGAFGF